MNLQKLMQQAQQMQEKMQREMANVTAEATVGGGMVTAKINGHKHLLSLTIDPEAVDPEDPSILQDLVVAAVNEAGRKLDGLLKERLGGMASQLPGF